MKTIYLVWKDPACNGVSPDWMQLTGKEFLELVRSAKGKNRHFIKLHNPDYEANDCQIVIEATKAAYADWKKEKNHADYLKKHNTGWRVISYHAMVKPDKAGKVISDDCFMEGILVDADSSFEDDLVNACALELALAELSVDERHLIEHLYMMDKPGTVRSYEQATGVSKSTASRRQNSALEKLRMFLANS